MVNIPSDIDQPRLGNCLFSFHAWKSAKADPGLDRAFMERRVTRAIGVSYILVVRLILSGFAVAGSPSFHALLWVLPCSDHRPSPRVASDTITPIVEFVALAEILAGATLLKTVEKTAAR